MTFRIKTYSIMTLNIMTFSIVMLSIMTFKIMDIIVKLNINDNQHKHWES